MPTSPQAGRRDDRPDKDTLTPLQQFWRRYSAHGEIPRSSLTSIGLHLLVIFIMILLAKEFIAPDAKPVNVDTVKVGEDADSAAGDGDGMPTEGDLEEMDPSAEDAADMPADAPSEAVQTEVAQTDPVAQATPTAEELLTETGAATSKAAQAVKAAKSKLNAAKEKLKNNMAKGQGGGSGGGGGSGAKGRAARPARWVLTFRTSVASELLAQYDGLGAKLAFPQSDDRYRYFSNLTASPPSSEVRSLDNEGRLYWIDENPQTVNAMAQALSTGNSPYMLAFLPTELEERMLKLELAYGGLEEDEIRTTRFEVVQRGGGYDVIVVEQIPK